MSVVLKLLSPEGEVLGSIGVPSSVSKEIDQRGSVRLFLPEPIRLTLAAKENINPSVLVKTAILTKHYSSNTYIEGVVLLGITLEEFEMMPEYWFTPGAAYIKAEIQKLLKAEV